MNHSRAKQSLARSHFKPRLTQRPISRQPPCQFSSFTFNLSSGHSASASKLYLGTLPTPKLLPSGMLETQLDVLHISASSSSCPGGLPHSSPGSDLDFFVRNVLYRPEKSEPGGAVRYLLEPLIYGTTQLGSNSYTLLFDDGDLRSSDARSTQFY